MSKFRTTGTWLLLIPGAALFGWGWHLDQNGTTAAHGFASNILASITIGCFAVPIATNIIQWILRQDANDRQRRRILRNAKSTLARMRLTVEDEGIPIAENLLRLTVTAASDLSPVRLSTNDPEEFKSRALEAANSLSILHEALSRDFESSIFDPALHSTLLRRWHFFTDTVMPDAETENIHVIPDWAYAEIALGVDAFPALPTVERIRIQESLRKTVVGLRSAAPGTTNHMETTVSCEIFALGGDLADLRVPLSARVSLYKAVIDAQKELPAD